VGIEVRIYNSLQKFVAQPRITLDIQGQVSVAAQVHQLGIDGREIYVAFKNGKPLGRGMAAAADTTLSNGDSLALSGPIPFSWGYGAPVC
jgi:sulfur carrier protein ThiS